MRVFPARLWPPGDAGGTPTWVNADPPRRRPAEMVNGRYPRWHVEVPQAELNYHYGFDLLVGTMAALTRGRVDRVIDGITILFWGWSFCLAWVMGERVTNSRGVVVATTLLFGGGIPILCAYNRPMVASDVIG